MRHIGTRIGLCCLYCLLRFLKVVAVQTHCALQISFLNTATTRIFYRMQQKYMIARHFGMKAIDAHS